MGRSLLEDIRGLKPRKARIEAKRMYPKASKKELKAIEKALIIGW